MCLVCVRCAPIGVIGDQADGLFQFAMDTSMGLLLLRLFIVVEMMNTLAEFAVEELDSAGDGLLEHWLALCNKVCGIVVVLLQLAVQPVLA